MTQGYSLGQFILHTTTANFPLFIPEWGLSEAKLQFLKCKSLDLQKCAVVILTWLDDHRLCNDTVPIFISYADFILFF